MRRAMMSSLAVLFLSALSHAEAAEGRFYILGAVGDSNADVQVRATSSVHGDDRTLTLGGGYRFNRHISLEADYQDFGRHTGTIACPPALPCLTILYAPEVDAAAWSMSVIGSFRIHGRLDGYGRLGLSRWKLDGRASIFDRSGDDLHYGAGLRWSFTERSKIFAEYTRVDLDLDGLRIGMTYGF